MAALTVHFDNNDVIALQVAMRQVSETTFTDKDMRQAMQALLKKLLGAIKTEYPSRDMQLEYGDF